LRACAGSREAGERDTPGLLAAELAAYSGLEGLYADFASFYRHIWEAALESPAPEEAVAEAALRAGVGAAPDSPLARRARELLWNLQGLPGEELPPGLPLLPGELEHIAGFVRRGAPPALLEPAVAMLEYRDNVYSLNAELTLRRLIGLPRVRRYLAAAHERAEGRLRERLSSILRAHRVAKQPGP
jgi:hypothetical protein